MKKTAALLVTTIMAASTLGACSGDSEYCAAVKKDRSTLDSFGEKRTDAAFTTYRSTTRSLAKLAPKTARADWTSLASAIGTVLKTQKSVGLKLEEVSVDSVAKLTAEQSESLASSYTAFNQAVSKHGKLVRANVKSECDITLQ